MKKRFCIFEIEYTESDNEYIDFLISEIQNKYLSIMDFFDINKLGHIVTIKIWNNLEKYRDYFSKMNKIIPDWEVAIATINKNEARIDLMCLKERMKCEGHQNDKLDNLLKVIVHEFVHICHMTFNDYNATMIWFGEGLATNLSNQFKRMEINCSLDDVIQGKAKYINYYSMVKYLLDSFGKDYVLKLSKDKYLLERATNDVYYETIKYIKNCDNH